MSSVLFSHLNMEKPKLLAIKYMNSAINVYNISAKCKGSLIQKGMYHLYCLYFAATSKDLFEPMFNKGFYGPFDQTLFWLDINTLKECEEEDDQENNANKEVIQKICDIVAQTMCCDHDNIQKVMLDSQKVGTPWQTTIKMKDVIPKIYLQTLYPATEMEKEMMNKVVGMMIKEKWGAIKIKNDEMMKWK
jgi:hypothetical protein